MNWSRFAPGFCGATLAVAAGLAWAATEFGSLRHAWLYANGARIVLEPPTIHFRDGRPGDVRDAEFLVYNLSRHPVQVLGANASCSCVSLDQQQFPVTIPPKGIRELRLSVHLGPPRGVVDQSVVYVTDEPTATQFVARVVGRVAGP